MKQNKVNNQCLKKQTGEIELDNIIFEDAETIHIKSYDLEGDLPEVLTEPHF